MGDLDEVKRMVKSEPGLVHVMKPTTNLTALHLSASMGHVKIVKYLVDRGADIRATASITTTDGGYGITTPLHMAYRPFHADVLSYRPVIDYLLQRGADGTTTATTTTARERHGMTPGDLAIRFLLNNDKYFKNGDTKLLVGR